jgi:hypothetical protein
MPNSQEFHDYDLYLIRTKSAVATVIAIVPPLPPVIDGVGDYAILSNLARQRLAIAYLGISQHQKGVMSG